MDQQFFHYPRSKVLVVHVHVQLVSVLEVVLLDVLLHEVDQQTVVSHYQ